MYYRAHVDINDTCLRRTAHLIRQDRLGRSGPRPKLKARTLALIALVHLRTGVGITDLAPAYGVGKTQLYQHVTRVVHLLEAKAVKLRNLTGDDELYYVLDGTLIRTDRVKAKKPGLKVDLFYSGKHKAFGVNLQAIMGADGALLWVSDGLPGSTHDMRAAYAHGILEHLKDISVMTLADSGYQGAMAETNGQVVTPLKGWKNLSPSDQAANKIFASYRCRGERGFAVLKSWKVMRRFTRSTGLVSSYAKAILVLERMLDQ